jgi:hypothetical protein
VKLAAFLAPAIAGAALITAAPAYAEYICMTDRAFYGLRRVDRTICDGPIQPDGSWERGRSFNAPADYNVWYTPSFGFEGAPIPELDKREIYQVFPNAIPFGEPSHLG